MKTILSMMLAAALMACGGKNQAPTTPTTMTPPSTTGTSGATLRISLATVYVDDQDKALRFYTEVLGFAEKDDFSNGPFRWLTVTAPGDANGTALQLALNNNPATKAYQAALFQGSEPAVMFYTDDVKGEYERIKALGTEFTMPPTEVMAGSIIATLKDTCGNLIQITQLAR